MKGSNAQTHSYGGGCRLGGECDRDRTSGGSTTTGAQAVEASPEPVLSEGQRALADARKAGERVEVRGQRSERTTVFANPDGYTFTLEEASVPVRVAKPGGGWQSPDAELERRPDGSIGPKAAAVQMSFSAGARRAPGVHSAAGPLARPRLAGQPARTGTDRRGRAVPRSAARDRPQGHRHRRRVPARRHRQVSPCRSQQGARKLTFGLHSMGLTVRRTPTGALAAVDASGATVFRAPTAQMWNSAGKATSAATPVPWPPRRPPRRHPYPRGPRRDRALGGGTGARPGRQDRPHGRPGLQGRALRGARPRPALRYRSGGLPSLHRPDRHLGRVGAHASA
ncbi:hypothetical protein SMICM17S_12640 [Streptomyces microflavus]